MKPGDRPALTPSETVLDLLAGRCRAQAVSTAAALGLADQLADGPQTTEELASRLALDAARLQRLITLLCSIGVLEPVADQGFALTALGETLRGDALGPLATFLGSADQWAPWAFLRESLAPDSPPAFEQAHGTSLYDFLAARPDAARRYDVAIDAFTRHEARALCEVFDFTDVGTLVDVGGGRGTLLRQVLSRWPHLRAVLFDLPHVIDSVRARAEPQPPEGVDLVAGDFFERVPAGADAYLLKHILHNWDDDRAVTLLQRCAAALAPGGRVLVIETILSPGDRADTARMLDLEMLVMTGGRERRKPELRGLFSRAGLTLEQTLALPPASHLLVGRPRT